MSPLENPTEALYVYRAKIVRVIDGDTIVADIDLGFKVHTIATLRLRGVYTPELGTPEGDSARFFLLHIFIDNTNLLVQTYKDKRSFERWIADVYIHKVHMGKITKEYENVIDRIIKSGHGSTTPLPKPNSTSA